VNIKTAQDQARPQGRAAVGRSLQMQRVEDRAGDQAEVQQPQPILPAPSGRRWSVRVHWGIVIAVVASLILWFAIKTVLGLLF